MKIEESWRWAFALIGFPLVGFASALVTVWSRWKWGALGNANLLGSLAFGPLLSVCFWAFFGLRSIRKILILIILSPVAAVIAVWAAVFVDGRFGIADPNDLRLYFIGGYVGAFLLLVTTSLLLAPKIKLLHHILESLCWAIAGGLLAAIGTAAGPLFHAIRMRLDPYDPDPDVSLIFVWHIGMALVLAVALYIQKKRPSPVPSSSV